ncbi:MAG: ChbG/HpnK family deacetylase [Reichenbachiella sp.]|uniref:ChbG/HpnK family deacetylase n=1 Tax=Reichenbachiella sp. TaxID=2184521 RepID=UPI00326797A1
MSKNLIITADDYTAHPVIDEGTEQAIDLGLVNTVATFTNMPDSPAKIKSLWDKYKSKGLRIGVHLSVTAGAAITGNKARAITDPDSPPGKFLFCGPGEVPLDRFFTNLNVLEDELYAQMKVLKDLGITIDHISCHHGILFLYRDLFKIVTDLACDPTLMTDGRPIPLRSLMLTSKLELPGYEESSMESTGEMTALKLLSNNGLTAMKGTLTSSKKICDKILQLRESDIHAPDLMIDTYYKRAHKYNLKRIIKKLPKVKFDPNRRHYIENHPFKKDGLFKIYELVVHLASRGIENSDPPAPNGVDSGYFKGRSKELDILRDGLLRHMDRFDVSFGYYEDCGKDVG